MAKTRLAKGKSKADSKEKASLDYFVDVTLPVPAEARHLIADPMLKLRYGTKSLDVITQATNSLTVSRRLHEGSSISGGHIYVLALARQQPNRSSRNLIRDVQAVYEGWMNDLRSDVITLAMFAENELLNEVSPYDETDEEVDAAPAYPWMKNVPKLPEPERDLTNAFEYRLKQIVDFLAECGWEFGIKVEDTINEGILSSVRSLPEETDANGFPIVAAGGDVPDNIVSFDSSGGAATE